MIFNYTEYVSSTINENTFDTILLLILSEKVRKRG